MRCKRYERMIALEAGGELTMGSAVDLNAHLASCQACRDFARELHASQEVLKSWRQAVPDEDLLQETRRNVMTAISRQGPLQTAWPRLGLFFLGPIPRFAGGVAAIGLIIAISWVISNREPASERMAHPGPVPTTTTGPSVPSRESTLGGIAQSAPKESQELPGHAGIGREFIPPGNQAAATKQLARVSPEITAAGNPGLKAGEFRRIEFQTADPNIRIIWLVPQLSRKPPSRYPPGT